MESESAVAAIPAAQHQPDSPTVGFSSRWIRWAILRTCVLVVVLVGALLWHRSRGDETASATAAQTFIAARGEVERTVASSGSVEAHLRVDIKARASGEVITLPFDVSDHVKVGELLLQLDPADEELAVRSAEAAMAESTDV